MLEGEYAVEKLNRCSKCNMMFIEPKLVHYYVCPHCEAKSEEKRVECEKVLDCILSELNSSPSAVAEIKKWY